MTEQEQRRTIQQEIVLTIVSTAVFIAMYYLIYLIQDPVKREQIFREVKRRLRPVVVPDRFQVEVQRFRAEISKWEHAQRRNAGKRYGTHQ